MSQSNSSGCIGLFGVLFVVSLVLKLVVHDALKLAIEKGERVLARHGDAMLVWWMEYDPIALTQTDRAAPIERGKIVDWLRDESRMADARNVADEIERGEHWKT